MQNDNKTDDKTTSYIKLAFWFYLLYFTFKILTGRLETLDAFLHNIDLPIHEFGHLFFGIIFGSGSLLMIAGGSITQVVFPAILTGSFFFRKDIFGGGVCSVWVGESLADVSYYIADARARDLPLITGDPDTHDWFNILGELNLLAYDTKFGKFFFFIAGLIMISGLIIALYSLNKELKFIEVKL